MLSLEAAIRLIVIGQELLIAVIFLTGSSNVCGRVSGALFLAGVAAYLATTNPELNDLFSHAMLVISFFSVALPYFLWLFAKDLFDSPMPPIWISAPLIAMGAAFWLVLNAGDRVSESAPSTTTFLVSRVASLVIVAHTLVDGGDRETR